VTIGIWKNIIKIAPFLYGGVSQVATFITRPGMWATYVKFAHLSSLSTQVLDLPPTPLLDELVRNVKSMSPASFGKWIQMIICRIWGEINGSWNSPYQRRVKRIITFSPGVSSTIRELFELPHDYHQNLGILIDDLSTPTYELLAELLVSVIGLDYQAHNTLPDRSVRQLYQRIVNFDRSEQSEQLDDSKSSVAQLEQSEQLDDSKSLKELDLSEPSTVIQQDSNSEPKSKDLWLELRNMIFWLINELKTSDELTRQRLRVEPILKYYGICEIPDLIFGQHIIEIKSGVAVNPHDFCQGLLYTAMLKKRGESIRNFALINLVQRQVTLTDLTNWEYRDLIDVVIRTPHSDPLK
jgi:hypothetical protein